MNNKIRKEIIEMYLRDITSIACATDVIRSVPHINMSQVTIIMTRSFKYHFRYEYYIGNDILYIVRYLRDKISSILSKS